MLSILLFLNEITVYIRLFQFFPTIERAPYATPATPDERAGVAYATPAPPVQAPLVGRIVWSPGIPSYHLINQVL